MIIIRGTRYLLSVIQEGDELKAAVLLRIDNRH